MHPLALYIHWPFCKSKCPYCDFNSHVREQVDQERWKNALLSELRIMAARTPGRELVSIFFGGGTPSLMPPETVAALIDEAHRLWKTVDNIEITLEANPTSVEAEKFAGFASAGVNRVSLGVQSLDAKELAFLGREHSPDEALRAVELAQHYFSRYSFDLIYARPGQTVTSWEKELEKALSYAGKHLSLYQLTIEENTAFATAYKKGAFALPDDATSEALYLVTEAMCASKGLAAYEVSNYAAPGEESRHNLVYWQGDEYIGIGPGAHGRLQYSGDSAPSIRIATQTLKSPERWLEKVERAGHGLELWELVEKPQEIEERIMMGLRLTGGIQAEKFYEQTGVSLIEAINPKALAIAQQQGLVEYKNDRVKTTMKGRLVLTALTGALLS